MGSLRGASKARFHMRPPAGRASERITRRRGPTSAARHGRLSCPQVWTDHQLISKPTAHCEFYKCRRELDWTCSRSAVVAVGERDYRAHCTSQVSRRIVSKNGTTQEKKRTFWLLGRESRTRMGMNERRRVHVRLRGGRRRPCRCLCSSCSGCVACGTIFMHVCELRVQTDGNCFT